MVRILFFLNFIFLFNLISAQELKGNWSGILLPVGDDYTKAKPIYLKLEVHEEIKGIDRIEILDNTDFALKEFTGTKKDNKIILSEGVPRRSSNTRNAPECKLTFSLQYDEETAYLSGTYESTYCRKERGTIVLFRSTYEVSMEKEPAYSHLWVHRFIINYKKGYPAPEILKKEQKEFKFQPIYFDHDKAEIKEEFYEYLDRMARILDAIHDLRVEIIGHTDAVGSDEYNIGLSERRSDAIRDYFKTKGIDPGKLEIDFKGKREPIATNKTQEGKQKNRRVVFRFI